VGRAASDGPPTGIRVNCLHSDVALEGCCPIGPIHRERVALILNRNRPGASTGSETGLVPKLVGGRGKCGLVRPGVTGKEKG